jgi:hypothetical protein
VAAPALTASSGDPAFVQARIATARFHADQIMLHAAALLILVSLGTSALYALSEAGLAA